MNLKTRRRALENLVTPDSSCFLLEETLAIRRQKNLHRIRERHHEAEKESLQVDESAETETWGCSPGRHYHLARRKKIEAGSRVAVLWESILY